MSLQSGSEWNEALVAIANNSDDYIMQNAPQLIYASKSVSQTTVFDVTRKVGSVEYPGLILPRSMSGLSACT